MEAADVEPDEEEEAPALLDIVAVLCGRVGVECTSGRCGYRAEQTQLRAPQAGRWLGWAERKTVLVLDPGVRRLSLMAHESKLG